MSKSLSLLFAALTVLFMSATAISLAHNVWIALLLFILTLANIAAGFIMRARLRRRGQTSEGKS